jgi:hypothetical protein
LAANSNLKLFWQQSKKSKPAGPPTYCLKLHVLHGIQHMFVTQINAYTLKGFRQSIAYVAEQSGKRFMG